MIKDKKNYMENRKIVNLTIDTWEKLDEIKSERDLKSLDSTVDELISLRDELYKKNMITDRYYCKKCNDKIYAKIDPNITNQLYKHRHRHIDHSSDCDGHLGKTCGVKPISDEEAAKIRAAALEQVKRLYKEGKLKYPADEQSDQTDTNDEQSDQYEQTDTNNDTEELY